MPAPAPTSTVRRQSARQANPTARAGSPRNQSEQTPKTRRNGVALNGSIPANPAARMAAATRSSRSRNRCARGASRKPPGSMIGLVENWGGRTRTSIFQSHAVDALRSAPSKTRSYAMPRTLNTRRPSGKPTPKPLPNRHRDPRLEDVPDAELHLPPRREVLDLVQPRQLRPVDPAPRACVVAHEAKHRRAYLRCRDPGLSPLPVDQVEHVIHVSCQLERLARDRRKGFCHTRIDRAEPRV